MYHCTSRRVRAVAVPGEARTPTGGDAFWSLPIPPKLEGLS
jgi:hypothetical protein